MNLEERTIIIGDVHGCCEELKELLVKVDYNPDLDRLIFLGDLVNKGPDSLGVLEIAHAAEAICLIGNHELALLRYVKEGRDPIRKSLQFVLDQMGDQQDFWLEWIASWPAIYEDEKLMVVHAGVVPEVEPGKTPLNILTRIRTWDGSGVDMDNSKDPAWYDLYKGEKLIVYGHWAEQGLNIQEKTIGLDSGCVWGGALSALIMPGQEIVQVTAKKQYLGLDATYD